MCVSDRGGASDAVLQTLSVGSGGGCCNSLPIPTTLWTPTTPCWTRWPASAPAPAPAPRRWPARARPPVLPGTSGDGSGSTSTTTMLPSQVVMQTVWSPQSEPADSAMPDVLGAMQNVIGSMPGVSQGRWPPPPPPPPSRCALATALPGRARSALLAASHSLSLSVSVV